MLLVGKDWVEYNSIQDAKDMAWLKLRVQEEMDDEILQKFRVKTEVAEWISISNPIRPRVKNINHILRNEEKSCVERKPPSSWKVFSYRQIIFVIRIPSKHHTRHSNDHIGRKESEKYTRSAPPIHLEIKILIFAIFSSGNIYLSPVLYTYFWFTHNTTQHQDPPHLQCTIRKAKTHGNVFSFFKEFY